MSKYLIRTTEIYRVDRESEAKSTIEEAKADKNYTLSKYSSEYKNRKMKGEIVDEWYRVTLVKDFTDEKEPDIYTEITYGTEAGYFPTPTPKEEIDLEDDEDAEF